MKKLLALVLALVMTLSLCTISNAAYSDAKDVDYKEAVDVMSAVGVFQGADGKFSPKAELTREQAAKLIAYLDLGEATAEALPAVKVFNDVEANRWSAKYVAYCADAGYLAGVGDNNFDPAGKLTGYAFGKMLLCVLGFDAAIEGFTGANWQIAVAKLMQSNDIAKSVDASSSATLTREAAAQYCLNALKATMVEYENKGTSITINGAVIATGASKAAEVTAKKAEKYVAISGEEYKDDTAYTVELGEKLYSGDLKVVAGKSTDDFGRPAVAWNYKNSSDNIGTYGTATPILTYTAAVKGGDLYTDLGKVKGEKLTGLTVYVDGKKDDTVNGNLAKIESGDKQEFGANGTLIEVYKVDGKYTFVFVNTYVGYISDYAAAKLDKNGDVATKENVTVTKYSTIDFADKGNVFNTTAFTKQDKTDKTVVLFTAVKDKDSKYTIKSVVAADVVENVKVTKVTGTTSFVAGETYKLSAKNAVTFGDKVVAYKNTVDVYTDAYGYAIYAKLYEAAEKDYAYVLNVGTKTDAFASKTYYAKLLMLDGTVETVELDKTNKDFEADTFASYTVDDGVYTLTAKGEKAANGTAIVKGQISAKVANKTVSGNANTIYIIAKTNSDEKTEYKFYTGYKNVPGVAAADEKDIKSAFFNTGDDNYVDYVFVDATKDAVFADDTSKVTYAFIAQSVSSNAVTDENGEYYTMNAVVDGKIKEVKLSKAVKDMVAAENVVVYTATAATFNSKGVITGLTGGKDISADKATVAAEYADETITLGETIYQLDKDLEVYSIDEGDDYAVTVSSIDEVAENDVVYFTVETDENVADHNHVLTVIYNFGH